LVFQAAEPLLPSWVDTSRSRSYDTNVEIRLRTGSRHRWSFVGGALNTEPGSPWRPDVVIRADPVALLLVFYRRMSQTRAIARAGLVATGRKPWRALRLPSMFMPP
jgi:hypothetical protein